jgi:amidase
MLTWSTPTAIPPTDQPPGGPRPEHHEARMHTDTDSAPAADADRGSAPEGLLEAVRDYERALRDDDLDALARAFAPGPGALRGDASGILAGHDAITAFRGARGGVPARTLREVQVRDLGSPRALVMAVTEPAGGGAGLLTQVWTRADGTWRIEAAHVQSPAPALDRTVWRIVGDPLLRGASAAPGEAPLPLAGVSVAVKDVVAVAGHAVGAGNPDHLAGSPVADRSAPALQALLAAGASVRGIARTDEFAYSIAGRNAHTGTPPNPRVPRGLPGGSTSGAAAAVALGHAELALGTDTAGSLRVPASYQGLWGLRTTHGRVSRDGVLPLAPTFDTVGWIARTPELLRRALHATPDASTTAATAPDAPSSRGGVPDLALVVSPALLDRCDPAVRDAFDARVESLLRSGRIRVVEELAPDALGDPAALAADFRIVQAAEAWQAHGAFVDAHPGSLGEDVAARFAVAATVTADEAQAARTRLARRRAELERVLAGRILLVPSASSAAPDRSASGTEVDAARAATLALTGIAGVLGRPALSAPLLEVPPRDRGRATIPAVGPGGEPVGLCLVGPRGSDLALIDLAESWAADPGADPLPGGRSLPLTHHDQTGSPA